MAKKEIKDITIITGVVGQDSHVIGTKVLSRFLRENGFKVVELGCLTPPEEFIKAAQETAAEAILMTSMYGMAEYDVADFKKKYVEAGLGEVILYIGGYLGVTKDTSGRIDFKPVEEKFKKLGFDRVYSTETDLNQALADLISDLKTRGKL